MLLRGHREKKSTKISFLYNVDIVIFFMYTNYKYKNISYERVVYTTPYSFLE